VARLRLPVCRMVGLPVSSSRSLGIARAIRDALASGLGPHSSGPIGSSAGSAKAGGAVGSSVPCAYLLLAPQRPDALDPETV